MANNENPTNGNIIEFPRNNPKNSENVNPIYLLSDSQLLFWRNTEISFTQNLIKTYNFKKPIVAYIGASNGDEPAYFNLLVEAFDEVEISQIVHIKSDKINYSEDMLLQADIIVLSGGDVLQGWNRLVDIGINQILTQKYADGALLMGIS